MGNAGESVERLSEWGKRLQNASPIVSGKLMCNGKPIKPQAGMIIRYQYEPGYYLLSVLFHGHPGGDLVWENGDDKWIIGPMSRVDFGHWCSLLAHSQGLQAYMLRPVEGDKEWLVELREE